MESNEQVQLTLTKELRSFFSGSTKAVIRAGIGAGKTIPFMFTVVILAALWAVGLLFVWQPLEVWATLPKWITMTTMCIVLGMITLLSLYPVALYAAFDKREKVRAQKHTLSELEHYIKHGQQYDDLRKEVEDTFIDLYREKSYRVPVPLATLAIMIGWVLFFFSGGADAVVNLARSGNISDLLDSLRNAHPVVFGFLGAFFFSLQMLFHRYIIADLKASVYMHIAVRTWLVMILTLVLTVVWPALQGSNVAGYQGNYVLYAACFMTGIFPNFALNLIQRATSGLYGKFQHVVDNNVPVTKIQGLNLFHQTRLVEEGIDNVQNLAVSDVIGLIVNTRLGFMRILDWVDQAILITYVGEKNLPKFREAGITTATGFESVYVARLTQQEREKIESELQESESGHKKGVKTYMGREGPSCIPAAPHGLVKSIEVEDERFGEQLHNMMIAICDDENFQRLWKVSRGLAPY